MDSNQKMTYLEHARDLRLRFIFVLGISAVLFTFLWIQSDWLLSFLQTPLNNLGFKLTVLRVEEVFVSTMKLAGVGAVILGFPLWGLVLGQFFLPVVEKAKKKYLIIYPVLSILLALGGFLFSYLGLIPISLKFLLGLSSNLFSTTLSLEYFLDYFLLLFISCGLGFQLPLVMVFLVRMKIVPLDGFKKARGLAILVLFFIAAVLTPPDVISQIGLGVPLVLLYEIGIFMAWVSQRFSHG